MNNRRAVTLRFNLKEQHDLNSLAEFYDFRDPKDALRLAFDQLVIATAQLQKKIAKEREDEKAKQITDGVGGVVGGGSVPGEPVPASVGGTVAAAADVPDTKPTTDK